MKKPFTKSLMLLTMLGSSAVMAAETSVYFDAYYKTKYVSKGRDLLDKGGIFWSEVGGTYDNFSGFIAIGEADSVDFTEVDIDISYSIPIHDDWFVALGYTGLDCKGIIDFTGHEFYLTTAYTGFSWVTPQIKTIYETESDGYFVFVTLKGNVELSEKMTLHPYIEQGLDYGYIGEKHDGSNHLELGLSMSYALRHDVTLSGFVARSFSESELTDWNNDNRPNQTFGGVKVSWHW
ncbi:hypothetical protein JQC92_15505 [Shewanella sp. 202IG2-18]|uniref:hypothetical protein n=1 Tax=Parashewanella hymeniacidonis TaxID=2807618 RepID=UPI0019600292|nr:hypothetical protein [Parashewanella hymeniacidonis]MBM7073421.1 hypothetical protein [Parashewanella hymeniacidonis]